MTRAELNAVLDVDGVEVEHVDKVEGGERWSLSFKIPAEGSPLLEGLLTRADVDHYADSEDGRRCVRFFVPTTEAWS